MIFVPGAQLLSADLNASMGLLSLLRSMSCIALSPVQSSIVIKSAFQLVAGCCEGFAQSIRSGARPRGKHCDANTVLPTSGDTQFSSASLHLRSQQEKSPSIRQAGLFYAKAVLKRDHCLGCLLAKDTISRSGMQEPLRNQSLLQLGL